MEKIEVLIGSICTGNSGLTLDTTLTVEFDGELIGTYKEPGLDRGGVSDSRGTVRTLYRADDGRLIVHIFVWSRWQNEADRYSLQQVTVDELRDRYPFLAAACGLGEPLTLDQALTVEDDDDEDDQDDDALTDAEIDAQLAAAWDARNNEKQGAG